MGVFTDFADDSCAGCGQLAVVSAQFGSAIVVDRACVVLQWEGAGPPTPVGTSLNWTSHFPASAQTLSSSRTLLAADLRKGHNLRKSTPHRVVRMKPQ